MANKYFTDTPTKQQWLYGRTLNECKKIISSSTTLSLAERTVLGALVDMMYGNDEPCVAFPSQDYLADVLAINKLTVLRATKKFQELGLIEIKRRGLGRTNIYKLNVLTPELVVKLQPKTITDNYSDIFLKDSDL